MVKKSKDGVLVLYLENGTEVFIKPPNKLLMGCAEVLYQAGYTMSLLNDILVISRDGVNLLEGDSFEPLEDEGMEQYIEVIESGFEGPAAYTNFLTMPEEERELYEGSQPENGKETLFVNGKHIQIRTRQQLLNYVTGFCKYYEATGKCLTHKPINSFTFDEALYTPQEFIRERNSTTALFARYVDVSTRLTGDQAKELMQDMGLGGTESDYALNLAIFEKYGIPFIKTQVLYKTTKMAPALNLSKKTITDGTLYCLAIKDSELGKLFSAQFISEAESTTAQSFKRYASTYCSVNISNQERTVYSIKASDTEKTLTVDVEIDSTGLIMGNNYSVYITQNSYFRSSITNIRMSVAASPLELIGKMKIFSILKDIDVRTRVKPKGDFITQALRLGTSITDAVQYIFKKLEDVPNSPFKDTMLATTIAQSLVSVPYEVLAEYFDDHGDFSELVEMLKNKPTEVDLYSIYTAFIELESVDIIDDIAEQSMTAFINLDPVSNFSAALKVLFGDLRLLHQDAGFSSDSSASLSIQNLTNCIYNALNFGNKSVLDMDTNSLAEYIEENFEIENLDKVKQSESLGLLKDCAELEKLKTSANSLLYVNRIFSDFGMDTENDIIVDYLKLVVYKRSVLDVYINKEMSRLEQSLRINIEGNKSLPRYLASIYRLVYPQAILENIWRAYFNKDGFKGMTNFDYIKSVKAEGRDIKITVKMTIQEAVDLSAEMKSLVTRELSFVNDLYCYNFKAHEFEHYCVNATLQSDKVMPRPGFKISRIPAAMGFYDIATIANLSKTFAVNDDEIDYFNKLSKAYEALRFSSSLYNRQSFTAIPMNVRSISTVADMKQIAPDMAEKEMYEMLIGHNDEAISQTSVIARNIKATYYTKINNPNGLKIKHMQSKFQKTQKPLLSYLASKQENFHMYRDEVVYSDIPITANRLRNVLGEVKSEMVGNDSTTLLLADSSNFKIIDGVNSGFMTLFVESFDNLHDGIESALTPKIVNQSFIDGVDISRPVNASDAKMLREKYNGILIENDVLALALNYLNKIISIKLEA